MPADDKTEPKPKQQQPPEQQPEQQTPEEDQFTKASAIQAARSIADASPHEMAGALWDKADDDPVTRQEAADAIEKLRAGPEGPEEE